MDREHGRLLQSMGSRKGDQTQLSSFTHSLTAIEEVSTSVWNDQCREATPQYLSPALRSYEVKSYSKRSQSCNVSSIEAIIS